MTAHRMFTTAAAAAIAACCLIAAGRTARADEPLVWHEDYFTAYKQAERDGKQLFIFFRDEQQAQVADSYELTVLTDKILQEPLRKFVLAVIPVDYTLPETGEKLLDFEAFSFQQHRQGIAVVDLVDSGSRLHGKVVSSHPFSAGRHLTAQSTKIILELPRGTITQRSLTYAARINPYRPAGAQGQASFELLKFSATHSDAMANWNSMYHSSFGGPEIVANIGPGATIVDTAKSIINMWQGSPPHWGILTRAHRHFGLDMKRSSNGHWYATGVFGN